MKNRHKKLQSAVSLFTSANTVFKDNVLKKMTNITDKMIESAKEITELIEKNDLIKTKSLLSELVYFYQVNFKPDIYKIYRFEQDLIMLFERIKSFFSEEKSTDNTP